MHCVHKAGGWQPKAAGGWFALLTVIRARVIDFRIFDFLLSKGILLLYIIDLSIDLNHDT
jgi:hypothetical protein